MRSRWWIIVFVITLAGCKGDSNQGEKFVADKPVGQIVSGTIGGAVQGVISVVQLPFEDIGIRQQPIPPLLKKISDNPYVIPMRMRCKDIRKEIADLDALLGPDITVVRRQADMKVSQKGEYVEEGAHFAQEQVVGVVRDKVDIIPFRGFVRRISGAEHHTKELTRAYEAGKLRRAFLKGVLQSLHSCQ